MLYMIYHYHYHYYVTLLHYRNVKVQTWNSPSLVQQCLIHNPVNDFVSEYHLEQKLDISSIDCNAQQLAISIFHILHSLLLCIKSVIH